MLLRVGVAVILVGCAAVTALDFNVVDFGGVGDGLSLNSESFRKAFEAAEQALLPVTFPHLEWSLEEEHHKDLAYKLIVNRVVVPKGRFLTGTIQLKSRVFLHLEDPESIVLGSGNSSDYPAELWNWDPALIDTANASWTGITGPGTIDGQALFNFVDYYSPEQNQFQPLTWVGVNGCIGECRPKLVRFVDSTNLFLVGVKLHNSPDWTILFRRCSRVVVDRISVDGSTQWANNDGMDIESGSFFKITNSNFSTGDDGIVLVSGSTNVLRYPWFGDVAPLTDVYVENCTVKSFSCALKFEAIMRNTDHKSVERVVFKNIKIVGSNRGIGFQQRSGSGSFRDVVFKNIDIETQYVTGTNWWGSGEPIWISTLPEDENTTVTGTVSNVLFQNIHIRSENGVLVSSLNGRRYKDLTFEDVDVEIAVIGNTTCTKGVSGLPPTGCKDYRPVGDPSGSIATGKTAGFAFEGDGEVRMKNVSVRFQAPTESGEPVVPAYWGECTEVSGKLFNVIQSSLKCSSLTH